jgi:hypothetical protein
LLFGDNGKTETKTNNKNIKGIKIKQKTKKEGKVIFRIDFKEIVKTGILI